MKVQNLSLSVPSLCDLLVRSRLLSAHEVKLLERCWGEEAEEAADLGRFSEWLVANRYLTEYQLAMLLRGHADQLFLDRYLLLERIGKGRMAGVYKAVDRLGQTVAIKILPPSKARDPHVLARFRREADLACRLEHPNVVRALRAGEANGLHYLVMEYLEGVNFQLVLDQRGRLPPVEAVHVIHQALLGLQHLHEQGLVHRNLEPANLMLVHAGGEPAAFGNSLLSTTVKILDISLSRCLFDEAASLHSVGPGRRTGEKVPSGGRDLPGDPTPYADGTANNLQLTHEGQFVGIPAYLAPEQARDAHATDIRADIYSLGCILYHALAGIPPFPDASLLGQVIRHATEKPRPLHAFNAEVPEALQLIVDTLMAKDPADRYSTPERAAEALHLFLRQAAHPMLQRPSLLDKALGDASQDLMDGAGPFADEAVSPAEPTATALRKTFATNEAANGKDDLIFAPLSSGGRAISSFRRTARSVRRDWLLLVLGAMGVLLAEVIGWLFAHYLHG